MADSTTTNRIFTQPEVGSSSNTWGTKLNAALALLDDLLGTIETVATTGGTTVLTDDQMANGVLRITGTLASNAVIEFDGRSAYWIVENATSGSYTVTVKINGQTGFEIAQGNAQVAYFDGTDMTGAGLTGEYQPLDSDLTSIAALTTAAFGRSLLEAATAAAARILLGAVIGTDVQAYDADTLKADVTAALSVGYSQTPYNAGTKSTGTFTPDIALGNFQYITNNGAFTLAAYTAAEGPMTILVTNGASAGTITFSGFTVGSFTGDALTTTDTNKFLIQIVRINGVSTYAVKALQ